MLSNVAHCPNGDCPGVVVISYHPDARKRFDAKTRVWTFICDDCGREFSAGLAEIRAEAVSDEWIWQHYPNAQAEPFS